MKSDWIDLKRKIGNLPGARHAFEEACVDIFQKKFPDKQVRGIKANPGDEGVDVYVGKIGVEPVEVYQCKYFIYGLGDSQKEQIRSSFRKAYSSQKLELKKWFLCIPTEMDLDEITWFNQWKQKQTVEIEFITGSMLIADAKEVGIYDLIFDHEDSVRIKAIYDYVFNDRSGKTNETKFDEFVARAEKDCFHLLQGLIHYHVAEFTRQEVQFHNLHQSAMAGDKFSACQYIKSVFAGNTNDKQKRSIFLILNDFSLEPIAHKYLKRYEALVDIAEKENKRAEIEHSMFNDIYKLLKDPLFSRHRKDAYWQVYV